MTPDSTCPICKENVCKSMLRFTHFELAPKLQPNETVVLALVQRNLETGRYEAFCDTGKNKTEMIQPVEIDNQLSLIENNVSILLNYQETNPEICQKDPEYRKAFEEAVHLVSSLGEPYFDAKRCDKYFHRPSKRKRPEDISHLDNMNATLEEIPIIKRKSSKKVPEKPVYFYQEIGGSNTYLHFLCQEFVDHAFAYEQLPKSIKVNFDLKRPLYST
jgi:hypothetical protein